MPCAMIMTMGSSQIIIEESIQIDGPTDRWPQGEGRGRRSSHMTPTCHHVVPIHSPQGRGWGKHHVMRQRRQKHMKLVDTHPKMSYMKST